MQAQNPKIHVERSFYRSLLALTLPVALQNVISYSVNLMDTLMLGGLGEVALSATSLANQVFFIYTVAIFGVAGGAIVLCRDRKSTRLNSSHRCLSRMPSSA